MHVGYKKLTNNDNNNNNIDNTESADKNLPLRRYKKIGQPRTVLWLTFFVLISRDYLVGPPLPPTAFGTQAERQQKTTRTNQSKGYEELGAEYDRHKMPRVLPYGPIRFTSGAPPCIPLQQPWLQCVPDAASVLCFRHLSLLKPMKGLNKRSPRAVAHNFNCS